MRELWGCAATYGNGIITNTSFVTTGIYRQFADTSSPIHNGGRIHVGARHGVPLQNPIRDRSGCHHGFHQYDALIMKMFSAGARSIWLIDEPNRKLPSSSDAERLCVHTKNSVEPGMYSHRKTALPRSDLKLKSGLYGAAAGLKS